MRKIKHCLAVIGFTIIGMPLFAQSYGGVLTNPMIFSPYDMLQMSQYNHGFTTARAAAMGGAFTSLGGDLATIGMNPAGLGMYRISEFGFTMGLNMTQSSNNFGALDQTKTRFMLNNLGLAANVFNKSQGVTSFTLGFAYNRVADFNYSGGAVLPGGNYSLAQLFTLQLNGLYPYLDNNGWQGITLYDLKNSPFQNLDIGLAEWGAVMSYLANINTPDSESVSNTIYHTNGIGANAIVTPEFQYTTRGYVNEYNFAGGINISNILYLGFTLGIQDIMVDKGFYYTERYTNNSSGSLTNSLDRMGYNQHSTMSGWGANIKLGAIVRPIPELRIGIAFHSPTWVSDFTKDYDADLHSRFISGRDNSKDVWTDYVWTDYYFNTPARLLTGISYNIGEHTLISADYESVWYNKMKNTGPSHDAVNAFAGTIKNEFRRSDNFRVGLEVKPSPQFALRGGYAYYGNALQENNDELIYSYMITDKTQNFSVGAGFKLGVNTSLDLAYIYSMGKLTNFDLFYYDGKGNDGVDYQNNPITTSVPLKDVTHHNHIVTMSLSFRF